MQGVRDVVGFARLCLQQLEIALEKIEEFLKLWLDFGDFQVSSANLSGYGLALRATLALSRSRQVSVPLKKVADIAYCMLPRSADLLKNFRLQLAACMTDGHDIPSVLWNILNVPRVHE